MSGRSWDRYDELADARERKRAGRATKSDVRRMKADAKQGDDLLTSAYEEGVKEGTYQAKRKATEHAKRKQKTVQAKRHKYPKAKKVARTIRQPVDAGTARGIRQAAAPVAGSIASMTRLSVMTMGVVALYLFLENAPNVSGALGAVSRGVEWLKAPNTSIPYVPKG